MFLELMILALMILLIVCAFVLREIILKHLSKIQEKNQTFHQKLTQDISENQAKAISQVTDIILKQQSEHKSDSLQTLLNTLKHHHEQTSLTQKNLTDTLHNRLFDISKQVDKRLEI